MGLISAPNDDLKQFATHAAQTLLRTGGLEGARQLRLLLDTESGEAGAAATDAIDVLPDDATQARVGIWKASADGTFVRALDVQQEWVYWASVGKIPAKGPRPRIAFLGESAARGFFYDPLFNPAKALELMMTSAVAGGVEIVDLARTDMTLPELSRVFDQSFALRPDAIVIYAGNNWGNTRRCERLPTAQREREQRAATLRSRGVMGLRQLIEDQLGARVEAFVRQVAARCQQEDVLAVLVVPEYNLVDWRDSRPMIPWLSGDRNRRWLASCRRAQDAMAEGQLEAAAAAAQEMLELDRGAGSLGLFILGECARQRGDFRAARDFLERARDSVLWDPVPHSPRGFRCVQQALRREAAAQSLGLVDMPQIFERHLDGELPDRRLFIDYCHLTIEGMRVAMASVAKTTLTLLGRTSPPLATLEHTALPVSPELEAQAHFATAIHNAHWGYDCDEVIAYHCRSALQKDPNVRDSMRHYMELTTRRAPVWMCSSTESLASSSANPSVARYIIGTLPMQPKVLDRVLCDTFADLLQCSSELEQLRIEEHARAGMPVDLLSTYSSLATAGDREALWSMNGGGENWAAYFKAYHAESRFVFMEHAADEGCLRLVARAPAQPPAGAAFDVEVNGRRIFGGELTTCWSDFIIGVPSGSVRRGINELRIAWPLPAADAQRALSRAAGDLELGRMPELYPVFAEIHSLVFG